MPALTQEFVVRPEESAAQLGSGDLAVLATPALIAYAENTCKNVVAEQLATTETTVGTMIQLDHLRASKIGSTIQVRAELTEQSGRKMTFTFQAFEGDVLIAQGHHQRALVDRERFLANL